MLLPKTLIFVFGSLMWKTVLYRGARNWQWTEVCLSLDWLFWDLGQLMAPVWVLAAYWKMCHYDLENEITCFSEIWDQLCHYYSDIWEDIELGCSFFRTNYRIRWLTNITSWKNPRVPYDVITSSKLNIGTKKCIDLYSPTGSGSKHSWCHVFENRVEGDWGLRERWFSGIAMQCNTRKTKVNNF